MSTHPLSEGYAWTRRQRFVALYVFVFLFALGFFVLIHAA